MEDVKCIFPQIICQDIPQELNKILFCKKERHFANDKLLSNFEENLKKLESSLTKKQKVKTVINVKETIGNIKII